MMFVGWSLRAQEVPEEPEAPELLLSPSIYYKPIITAVASSCDVAELVDMLSPEGKVMTSLCPVDFNRCVLEGACSVYDQDGRMRSFNYYARSADGLSRFKEVDLQICPYGYGVRNICLDPYFTVAADLNIYKLGDVIFVPRMVGELMPDGDVHDGFFVIRDAGTAIKGSFRFDFYTGFTKPFEAENPFFRLGFASNKNSFEFRVATEEEALRVRERTKYPSVRKEVMISPRPSPVPSDVVGE